MESQAVFQAETQAKIVSIELPSCLSTRESLADDGLEVEPEVEG